MKIGLITHHWVPNFGANLQALASVKYLTSLGHELVVIDYRPRDLVKLTNSKISNAQVITHEAFVDKYFDLTELYSDREELLAGIGKYNFDIVISGSDALFRLDYSKNREDVSFPNPFWLDWTFEEAANVGKGRFISVSNMGSSFSELKADDKTGIIELLNTFEVINVRDSWTKKELLSLSDSINIKETIDPVFLLKDYINVSKREESKYLLICPNKGMLSADWLEKFKTKANSKGFKLYGLPHPEGLTVNPDQVDKVLDLPLDPLSWYKYIVNSSGYIGVRFHPIIVALSNNVPFVSLDTYQKKIFSPQMSKTYDITKKIRCAQVLSW